jgi:hypothetical protein
MKFADFYGIPEDTAKRMFNNGHISCSVERHFDIYGEYKKFVQCCGMGKTKEDIYTHISETMRVSSLL